MLHFRRLCSFRPFSLPPLAPAPEAVADGGLAGRVLPGCQPPGSRRSALGTPHTVYRLLTGSGGRPRGGYPRGGKHRQVVPLGTFCGLLKDCLPVGPGHLAECLHLAYGLWLLLGNSGLAKALILRSEQRHSWHLAHCSLQYCAVPLSVHQGCERLSLGWGVGISEVRSFLNWL